MTEDAEVDWRAIAQVRCPLCEIYGDGPFAAMPRGEGKVYLFRTIFERTKRAPPNSQLLTLRLPEQTRKTGPG